MAARPFALNGLSGSTPPPEPTKRDEREEHQWNGEPASPLDGFARIADDLHRTLTKGKESDAGRSGR